MKKLHFESILNNIYLGTEISLAWKFSFFIKKQAIILHENAGFLTF